jgi:hypothetical protein
MRRARALSLLGAHAHAPSTSELTAGEGEDVARQGDELLRAVDAQLHLNEHGRSERLVLRARTPGSHAQQ